MALLISNAILHVLSNTQYNTYYSSQELDIDSETCYEFITKHVRRLINAANAKKGTFQAESEVYGMVRGFQKGELRFKEFSLLVCQRLESFMQNNSDIPSGDVLVVAFDNGNQRYLAIVKLNFGECFTHKIVQSEQGTENHLIKQTDVLPISSAKVQEACLIPYDPMVLHIIEKPYCIDGAETNYFSQLFLQCETEMSKKEVAEIIHQITQEVNADHFNDDIEVEANVKIALMNEAMATEDDDAVIVENVARNAFRGNPEATAQFVEKAKEAGLPHQLPLDKSFVRREFKTQVFKADNGIEIKYPTELSNSPDILFAYNDDGTMTITLKNLRKQSKE